MRIIGGHDYYDSALAYGRDDDILFVRDNRQFMHKDTPLEWPVEEIFSYNGRYADRYCHVVNKTNRYTRALVLYICGVRYFGVEVYESFGSFREIFWTYDKLVDYATKHKLKIVDRSKWSWRPQPSIEDLFNLKTTKEQLDWLIENRVALAVGGYENNEFRDPKDRMVWYCNDAKTHSLRSLQFQKVMDPFTLFQELSMFVGNLPKDGPPMVQITDPDIKIAKHGFDKWSFRRHKDDAKK